MISTWLVSTCTAQDDLIIELGEDVVEGSIDKPEAFYILQPMNLNYEPMPREESFLEELLETVEEAPF